MCALVHDLIQWNIAGRVGFDYAQTLETMAVVFVGGYLTAGGAHTFNNVIDRDIDPTMERTAAEPSLEVQSHLQRACCGL